MGKSSNWDGLYCSDAIADITKLYRKIVHRLLNSVIAQYDFVRKCIVDISFIRNHLMARRIN